MPQTLPSQPKARTSGSATSPVIDAAVKQLAADGFPVSPAYGRSRISVEDSAIALIVGAELQDAGAHCG
ncbi:MULTISPECIES: hypothetical protein [unclassified Streptomyces]|uniref:hypothetical protein n=1 Tax=unclassified Streptomyces TaxID=2593676 RepID=UPI0036FF02C9